MFFVVLDFYFSRFGLNRVGYLGYRVGVWVDFWLIILYFMFGFVLNVFYL